MTTTGDTLLTYFQAAINGVSLDLLEETSVVEVSLTESLSTPGLQTSLIVQSVVNTLRSDGDVTIPAKNLDEYYGKTVVISANRPVIHNIYGDKLKSSFQTTQKIYKLTNRGRVNYNVEEFQLDACDPSLIDDAKKFVSRSWKGVRPDRIVRDVLYQNFPGITADVEESNPVRDYIATNIHPFHIILQQAEVALVQATGIDPSFIHFMTYQNSSGEDSPTHNFRSLTKMAAQEPVFEFSYSGKAASELNYANPKDIMDYKFPNDFDLLSDVLNGVDNITGKPFYQVALLNPLLSKMSVFGPKDVTKTTGTTPWAALSNLGTENAQNSNNIGAESFQLLRNARKGLIDMISLRMVLPFSPFLNVGRTINAKFYNTKTGAPLYGTGKYLIANMTHTFKLGGFGTTTVECVANSVSEGRV